MNYEVLLNNLNLLLKQRNMSMVFASVLLLSNALLVIGILSKSERVVLVPPDVKGRIWLEQGRVSKEYLEEMSLFFSRLFLDIGDSNAGYQREVILRHVDPKYYTVLKKRLIDEEQALLKSQVVTDFKPLELAVDNKMLEVKVTGDLISYINGKFLKQERNVYRFKYRYNGELLITDFEFMEKQDV